MAAKEPTLAEIASMLGISQQAAQRHAKAAGGSSSLVGKVLNAMSHILGGGSRRTLPDALPKELLDGLGRALGGDKAPPTFSTTTRPKRRLDQPPTKEEEDELSDEYLVPSSSNVYSYQYHQAAGAATGTLFVTFRAVNLNADSLSSGRVHHGSGLGRKQLRGKAGKTVAGGARPFVPGVKYQYFKVPRTVFDKLRDSHSKGKAVWDLLRVRGSLFGTQFSYSVASAQVTPGLGEYLPRKATSAGYRTRSLANVGTGRRSFITSTIPQAGGFSTRRGPK